MFIFFLFFSSRNSDTPEFDFLITSHKIKEKQNYTRQFSLIYKKFAYYIQYSNSYKKQTKQQKRQESEGPMTGAPMLHHHYHFLTTPSSPGSRIAESARAHTHTHSQGIPTTLFVAFGISSTPPYTSSRSHDPTIHPSISSILTPSH